MSRALAALLVGSLAASGCSFASMTRVPSMPPPRGITPTCTDHAAPVMVDLAAAVATTILVHQELNDDHCEQDDSGWCGLGAAPGNVGALLIGMVAVPAFLASGIYGISSAQQCTDLKEESAREAAIYAGAFPVAPPPPPPPGPGPRGEIPW